MKAKVLILECRRKPPSGAGRAKPDAASPLRDGPGPAGPGQEPSRHVCFQVGEASALRAFLAEATLTGDPLPPHGANGPGPFALGNEEESFDAWWKLLQGHSVSIENEVEWPRGGRSLYFRDSAGNSVDLVTPGVWVCRAGGEQCRTSSA
jgi:hypothetical protein